MKKVFLIIVGVVMLVLVGVAASFAFYSLRVSGTPSGVTITAGKLRIFFNTTQYINTTTASPILSTEVDTEADIIYFNISNNTASSISGRLYIEDIVMASELNNEYFKWKLTSCSSSSDTLCTTSSESGNFYNSVPYTSKMIKSSFSVSANTTNYYALRIWLEDNGGDQTSMMGKAFYGRIAITPY